MSIKKKYRVLFLVLACFVLVVGSGLVVYHGEWWYPVGLTFRSYPDPDFSALQPQGTYTLWTLETLAAQENAILSDNLLLVNSAHPLPEGYVPKLVEYNGAKMHPLMLDPYIALRDDVQQATDVRIYVASDFRTSEEQEEILNSSEEGVAAQIGCSEHEAGLALDVYAPYCAGINFLRSPAGRMVNEICGEYGYIIRYPYGKEDITEIDYEPWHIRYVGQPHARIMMDSGLTLEEYIERLVPDTWYESGDYLFARLSADSLSLPNGWLTCDLSPDNTGYYIVTLKMK